MANTTTPRSSTYSGWFYDAVTPAQKFYNRGTLVFTVATANVTAAGTLATQAYTITGDMTISGDANIAGVNTYTWPANDGNAGQQLETNGTGTLTWAA